MKTRIPLLLMAILVGQGCASDPQDVSYSAIAGNLSPEMQGTVDRPVDINRHMNATSDINARMFWDDLARMFYTSSPSRLSAYPITGTSGQRR